MTRTPSPRFLERRTYRRRRLGDAARLLPVLGILLFLVPLLWAPDAARTARGVVYIFAVWAGLIGAAALLSRPLSSADAEERPATGGRAP